MNTFYYTIEKQLTNMYDGQALRITGHIKVYEDEAKQKWLTDMPFSELGVNLSFAECPHSSADEFNAFVENKALEGISKPEIQAKLNQVKLAYDLGLL